VQFTRNPHGIANALKKIGGSVSGSHLANARANDVSHMFFGQAVTLFMNGLMATHPPLPLRIRAIEPRWDGRFLEGAPVSEAADVPEGVSGLTGLSRGSSLSAHEAVVDAVGNPSAASLAQAQTMIAGLPARCVEASHDPWSARALVCVLLLPDDRTARAALTDVLEPQVVAHLPQIEAVVGALDDLQRLTLVSMSVPALLTMSRPQYDRFVADVVALIRADRRVDLFEWVMHRVLLKGLKSHFEGPPSVAVRHRDLDAVRDQVAQTLSAIAHAGGHGADAQRRAFDAGAAAMELDMEFAAASDPNFTRLNEALRDLRALHPLAKPRLIKGCAACALTDGATSSERALLIGIAATLDCPLPPDLAL
jgi:hypothetical protein